LVEVGIEVVDLGVLTHQSADCPEAEVAGFGFRTIGRLVNQYSSVKTSITHYQTDRGGLRIDSPACRLS
jgi:hypothetical protein